MLTASAILLIFEILLEFTLFYSIFHVIIADPTTFRQKIIGALTIPLFSVVYLYIASQFGLSVFGLLIFGLLLHVLFHYDNLLNWNRLNALLLFIIVKNITEFILSYPINLLGKNELFNQLIPAITFMIINYFIAILLFKKLYAKIIAGLLFPEAECLITYALFGINILFPIYFMFIYLSNLYMRLLTFSFIITSLLISIMLLLLMVLNKYLRLKFANNLSLKQIAALTTYSQTIEQDVQQTRQFQHDYKNILLSSSSYIENNNLTGLKEIISNLIEYSKENVPSHSLQYSDLQNIHHSALNSIILIKLTELTRLNIPCQFECPYPVYSIPIDDIDLVRILGILLDNAREYIASITEGNMSILLNQTDQHLEITITNTYLPDHFQIKDFKQKGFSLKGASRGIGLDIVQTIENKYNNVSIYYEKNTIFSAKLVIT